MGFLRRKSSTKEKNEKKSDNTNDEGSRSRNNSSAGSLKRRWSLKKSKKEEVTNISDAELVYSTYSGSNVEQIDGTLKRKPHSPPPSQLEFYDRQSPQPMPQVQPVTKKTKEEPDGDNEKIKEEDIDALKDLLKTFSGQLVCLLCLFFSEHK